MQSCECDQKGSALNWAIRSWPWSSTSVRLSGLSLISCVVYLLSLCEFLWHYSSACSAVQCLSRYIDVMTTFPWVPVHNFTARVMGCQWVPIDTPAGEWFWCNLTLLNMSGTFHCFFAAEKIFCYIEVYRLQCLSYTYAICGKRTSRFCSFVMCLNFNHTLNLVISLVLLNTSMY